MPIDAELRRSLYNRKEWKEAVTRVRARAGDRCECRGLCGMLHNVRGDGRCLAIYSKARPLTVAHVDHDSGAHVADDRLLCLCDACHLRYDQEQHLATQRRKQRELGEARGQRRLV